MTPTPGRRSFSFATWFRWSPAGWHHRHSRRIDLAEIDHRLLRDLGLTPEDVPRECAKSFWRP